MRLNGEAMTITHTRHSEPPRPLTVLLSASQYKAILDEQVRIERDTGLRVSKSTAAASLIGRKVES